MSPGGEPDGLVLWHAVPFASTLCVGGALVVWHTALAFAITVRSWPRRALLWAFAVSATTVLGTVVGAAIREKLLFPMLPTKSFLLNSTFDLFFAMAWNVQLPILIGEPILAGLLGHWLYLAAREYAILSLNESDSRENFRPRLPSEFSLRL